MSKIGEEDWATARCGSVFLVVVCVCSEALPWWWPPWSPWPSCAQREEDSSELQLTKPAEEGS